MDNATFKIVYIRHTKSISLVRPMGLEPIYTKEGELYKKLPQ